MDLHDPDNALFISQFNAAPGKEIRQSGPATHLQLPAQPPEWKIK
jgi:hypothetical protein